MALKSYIALESGLTIPEAYIKVMGVEIQAPINGTKAAVVTVDVYASQEAREAGKPEVCAFTHKAISDDFIAFFDDPVLIESGMSPISQAYEWLKTLPTYIAATNVVDDKD